jgi:hypothetical protein
MKRLRTFFGISVLALGLSAVNSPVAKADSRCWNNKHDHNFFFYTVETHYLLSYYSSYPYFYYTHYRNDSSSPVGYQGFVPVECPTQNW